MLFDWLVVSQITPVNPASSVRGPKHVVKTGKTPALSAEDARRLLKSIPITKKAKRSRRELSRDDAQHQLDSIPVDCIVGIRDRALIATMCFTFARVGAVVGMRVEDYYQNGKRWWVRLHEKGGNATRCRRIIVWKNFWMPT
jgi:site-specific recombinase XerC